MSLQILGRLLGLQPGGAVRAFIDQIMTVLGIDSAGHGLPAQNQAAFTIAVVTLAAKMSKADGVSSDVEVAAFERIFDVAEGERKALRRVFDLARQDVAGFEVYAGQLAPLLKDEPALMITVLECLLHIATADGVLHPSEDVFLSRVADLIGVEGADYKAVRRAFVHDPDSPYDILGVSPKASEDEIKQKYRALVREHHPDLLVAKGVPEEFLKASGRRLAAINEAYEAVMAERGKSVPQRLESAP